MTFRPLPPTRGGERVPVPAEACPECWEPARAISYPLTEFRPDTMPERQPATIHATIHPCGHVIGDQWEQHAHVINGVAYREWHPA